VLLERYRFAPGPPAYYAPHVHDTYQFGIALDSGGTYRYREANHAAPTHAIVIIHPGERHGGGDSSPQEISTRYLMLYADPELLRAAGEELSGRWRSEPYFDAPVFDRDLVRGYLSLFNDDASWELARDSRLLSLFARLIERHADERRRSVMAPAARPALRRARDYLHAHPASNIRLDELSAVAGMSRYHLLRQFAREFGAPPHAFHLQLRLDVARRLLAAGVPTPQVALRTGFYDQSHLGRHFRRVVGVSPGHYRPMAITS
jgi:AraC-like DNA-binding protein